MRVLLTGGDGQVARALMATRLAGTVIEAPKHVELDITDCNAVFHAVRRLSPDIIINAAAYTAVDRAEVEPDIALAVNGQAVENLVAAASGVGARLVQISSDLVFSGKTARAYRPGDPTDPLNVYGRTKLAGEHAALAYASSLVVRTSRVYAAKGTNFVRMMLHLMAQRQMVEVVDDQIGTPTSAAFLAGTIWALIEHDATGIFHVTDAGVASWYDFAVAIQEEALTRNLLERAIPVLPISTADFPTSAQRPAFSVLDKEATWSLLGYPTPHWRQGLRQMLDELKSAE